MEERISGLRQLARAVIGFGAVSGIGLGLDFCLFLFLVAAGLHSAMANLISATAAVSFVYFASVSRIFSYRGRFLLPLFALYLVYQAGAVLAASLAVGYLAGLLSSPAMAKLAVLPATFSANFIFMSLLTRKRREVVPGV